MSDRVTVLRKGKQVATVNTSETSRDDLACMMVGRVVSFKVDKEPLPPGEIVLDIKDLHLTRENGVPALDGFSLEVHASQILGLAGVAGNGQKELYDVIVGVMKPSHGEVLLSGSDITGKTPLEINLKGLAGIPPDRIREGLIMDFSVKENLILGMHHSNSFQHFGLFNPGAVDRFTEQSVAEYDISLQSAEQPARKLSGGNLQKVILARELSQAPRCVIASSPTRGLDVGAMEFVYSRLLQLRSRAAAILLISEDLDEIFNVADVVAVVFKGRVVGVCRVADTTKEQVGLLMAGIQEVAND